MSDHLLPPNSTPLERDLASSIARLSDVPVLVRDVWDPDNCPLDVLPWLAWAFSVDTWDSNWSEAQKRATVKQSIAVHRYKGTIGAVEEALEALGYGVQVQEWFAQSPEGDPYTFKLLLEVDQIGIDLAGLLKAIAVVMTAKNLRSHLDSFDLSVRSNSTLRAASAIITGNDITVGYATSYVPDPDAEEIIAAMETPPTDARAEHITGTVRALKDAGIWGKADVLCFRAAADQQAGLLDWKRLVDGSWTAGSGYFVADGGFDTRSAGGGTGIYTGYTPSTDGANYLQDSACIASFVSDYVSGNGYIFGADQGANSGSSYLYFAPLSSSWEINSNSFPGDSDNTISSPNGFWILQRTASDEIELYKDGSLVLASSTVSSGIPGDELQQGGNNGSVLNARQVFLYAGAPLDSTERAALETIVNDYLAGL